MDATMREYISLFERKEIDSQIIDDILFEDIIEENPLTVSLNEAIEQLQDFYIPECDTTDISYKNGVYDGIEISVNIRKSILNKRES